MSGGISTEAVRLTLELPLSVIAIDRPAAKNSLRLDEMTAIADAIGEAVSAGARAVLVRGTRHAFCAGRDLKDTHPETDDTLAILRERINPVLAAVRDCPVPTIAAVQGPALGFGFGLALACDIALVADDALLGSPFRNIGAVLDSGGHHHLRERVGQHRAAELIFLGRLISGREAAAMGLVNRSVAAEALDEIALQMAREIAGGPTAAFVASKRILSRALSFEETLELEAIAQTEALAGPDGIEGIGAFQQKRKPRFIGR